MKTLRQILAIARTEFRFALRRGAPVVVTAVIGILLGAGILISWRVDLSNADPNMEQFTPEQVARLAENGITPEVYRSESQASFADSIARDTFGAWFSIYLALLFLPIATAGAIPADRQYGVFELLRSMPLDGWTYLAGKVLGLIGIVFFIACFPFLLLLAILEGIMLSFIGLGLPFELIALFLKLTLVDSLPVLAGGAALGVLAGIAIRSRRASVLPGLGVGILGILGWLWAFRSPPAAKVSHDILAYHVFQGYHSLAEAALAKIFGPQVFGTFHFSLVGDVAPPVGIGSLVLTYIAILAAGAGLFTLARLWLLRKENF